MLPCPLYQLTGWQCPYCGLQRSVVELCQGHWADAWGLNPLFWLTSPYLLLLFLGAFDLWGLGTSQLYRWARRDRTLLGYGLIMLVWGVLRNVCL